MERANPASVSGFVRHPNLAGREFSFFVSHCRPQATGDWVSAVEIESVIIGTL